jgi:DNA-binding MarR family transcriptional regulator
MERKLSELTMLLIYLNSKEETKTQTRTGKNQKEVKVLKSWVHYKYEILDELQNQGLIRRTPGARSLTISDKGKQAAEELKNKLLEKTNDQLLKGLDIKPWTKSLLPCHIPGDDKEYAHYLELIELMRMPEIEKIILGKLADLKIVAWDAIDKFFEGLK